MREITSDGTLWGSDEWYKARWASVPDEMKEKIIARLKELTNLNEVKDMMDDPWFHHSGGMMIRNWLRRVVKDNELPFAPYPGGSQFQNWDDFYVQAIEAALDD